MSSNDEKRNRKVELSREAEVLKRMRELRSLSVRNVGDIKSQNPNFGGSTPHQLVLNGRYQYVVEFILASKNGY